ncbi:MAG: GNAT family N-acetyltransferase [Clostridia bacterium]
MIFYAQDKDLTQIIELWNECFPGETDFTNYFFENLYRKENTIVLKVDEQIVAMLQMLPYESSMGDVTYIYGVATAKNHRKKGYAEQIMNKSFEISRERGHKFSVLIPAEAWLFDFYKKYGYETRFYYKTIGMKNYIVKDISCKLNYDDFEDFCEIYENAIKGDFFIKRDRKYFEHQINLYGDGAMKYVEDGEIIGYSFGYFKDDVMIIDEIFATDINKCLQSFSEVSCRTYGTEQAIGVIKVLGDENLPNNGYFNLMFN